MKVLIQLLDCKETQCLELVIQAIYNILKVGKLYFTNNTGKNSFKENFEFFGGVEKIENL